MTTQIKRATITDVKHIAPLFDDYRVFYEQTSDIPLAERFLKERLANDESIIFYAINETEETLGFVQLYPSFSSVSAKRLWILNDLFVTASARRSGVAKQLMNRAKDYAEESKAKGLFLETGANNKNGQALYESLGYQKLSEFFYFLPV
jgi:ribosomal protein S18 acetylase RimI-like enzyme